MKLLLAIRFLAELGMLACLGVGGWRLGSSLLASVLLSVVLPLLAAMVWGRWVAPRAPRRLRDPGRLGVEVTVFAAAVLVSADTGPSPAMLVVGVAVWVAFLASIPSRRYEFVLAGQAGARGVK